MSTLLNIVSSAMNELGDEVEQSRKFLNEGCDSKILLSDALNVCEYNSKDLQVFYDYMCKVLHKFTEIHRELSSIDNKVVDTSNLSFLELGNIIQKKKSELNILWDEMEKRKL